jgi:Leucine-rich repeat (LRR) protein
MYAQNNDLRISVKCKDNETRFPIEYLNLWDMTELEIIGGNFTYFPEDISILKNLRKISLISTKISQIPKEIFELPELTYLSLKNNRINELPILEKSSTIEQLILGRNYLHSKDLDSFFYNLPNLHNLDLGHNFIQEIPESIFYLKSLQRLNLENNQLRNISEKLNDIKTLNHLSISNNPIPLNLRSIIEQKFNISF